ncbi:hypothetical protein [Streptomyces sp. Tue6028]|uniref:hypothetical protein n=1 Tax=Streptomyces sp. Tue6028 TaxID=2036037 RepID=UPI003EB6DC38
MARLPGSPGRLARVLCGALVVWALANAAAGVAAWHRYQLLPSKQVPDDDGVLVRADMWQGNLMGWREAALVVSVLLLIAWLDEMRGLADVT